MKSIGKIGVYIFLTLFLFPFIGLLIQQIIGITEMRATWPTIVFALIGPYFFTYSKWANDNIWNPKIATPINNSNNTSNEPQEIEETVEESLNDNKNILGDINLPSLGNSKNNNEEILKKIEELKKQIENLENSFKKDDLSKEELEKLERLSKREAEKNLKGLGEHRESNQIDYFWIAIVIIILLAILLPQIT